MTKLNFDNFFIDFAGLYIKCYTNNKHLLTIDIKTPRILEYPNIKQYLCYDMNKKKSGFYIEFE